MDNRGLGIIEVILILSLAVILLLLFRETIVTLLSDIVIGVTSVVAYAR